MDQELTSIGFRNLSDEQLRTLAERTMSEWNKQEVKTPIISFLIEDLESHLPMHHKILMRLQGSDFTEMATDADSKRDRAIRYLYRKIDNATLNFDDSVAASAEKLSSVVESVGTQIHNLSYSEQSSASKILVKELRSEENLPHVEAIAIAEDIDRVDTLSAEFDTIWDAKVSDGVNKEDLPPIRDIRNDISSSLRRIFDNTEYLVGRNHRAVENDLFGRINSHIAEAVTLVKRRNTDSSAS